MPIPTARACLSKRHARPLLRSLLLIVAMSAAGFAHASGASGIDSRRELDPLATVFSETG